MAFFDTVFSSPRLPRLPALRPLDRFKTVMDTPFDARARTIRARIAHLRACDDAELAARGLSRADIVRHVLMTSRR
ncbi:hypothetical protein ROJ8625_01835 [Roseivivax jejudonensis]|uniref:DUF1127 domain-containing protein n=1 Tax=Roseivivax jejudonensis TaxID=1529041 RepID=A0A1X6Z302_9RHOB|nr:hypothetical protein [Roseivivax jejudonensis]SLN39270.1 hypothetical protein ROJ8625_01835 [Roseivivax jejudonensis]